MPPSHTFTPDRSRPPAPGEPRGFRFPPFQRHQLDGGPEVLVARVATVPLVQVNLLTPSGAQYQPAGDFGLAVLTASLLDEGTERSSALEIAAAIEHLGGSLTSGADWNVGNVKLDLLARNLPEGLELLAEILTGASFPETELERLRRQHLAELLRRRDSPSSLADDTLARVLYGPAAYGTPLLGTEENLRRLERSQIVDFYRARYRLPTATLVAVGDVDPNRLANRVAELFDSNGPAPAPASPPAIDPPGRQRLTVHVVDRPKGAQTELRIGQVGVERRHPDFTTLSVMNSLLGGKFTSRINLNLRERHGFTYGAFSRFLPRLGPGPFYVGAAVATEHAGAAARETLRELERIREEPVTSEELEDAKNYVIGTFPYTLQTITGLARRLENLATFGLPDDHYDHYLEEVLGVDRAAVQEVARRHLDPGRMAVVAVGPAGELVPQLEELGPVELVG